MKGFLVAFAGEKRYNRRKIDRKRNLPMKELFKRLRAFLKEKYAGALALVLCLMVLVLVLCLVFGGRISPFVI